MDKIWRMTTDTRVKDFHQMLSFFKLYITSHSISMDKTMRSRSTWRNFTTLLKLSSSQEPTEIIDILAQSGLRTLKTAHRSRRGILHVMNGLFSRCSDTVELAA